MVRKLREADGLRFGNSIVEVRFDEAQKSKTFSREKGPFGLQYTFTLRDAVTDCDEWMVPKAAFTVWSSGRRGVLGGRSCSFLFHFIILCRWRLWKLKTKVYVHTHTHTHV